MKKTFIFLLIAILSISLVACGGSNGGTDCQNHNDANYDDICDSCGGAYIPACGGHTDEDGNWACDKCGATYAPICIEHKDENKNALCDKCGATVAVSYSVTFVTKDDEGIKIQGLILQIENEYDDVFTATSDAEGIATVTLEAGEYRVSYKEESIPENYLCYPKTIVVNQEGMVVALTIENNTPNGTAARPYVVTEDVEILTVPANATQYYKVPHASDRTLVVTGANFTITYNAEVYEAVDGEIRIKLIETDPKDPSLFSVTNNSDAELNAPIVLESVVGSQNNPIAIESLNEVISATLSTDGSVFYKFVANFTGTLKIESVSESKNIKATNSTNSIQAELDAEGSYLVINVTAGDVVSIVVSATADTTVEFILSIQE